MTDTVTHPTDNIRGAAEALHAARQRQAAAAQALAEKQAAFDAEHAEVIAEVGTAKQVVELTEKLLRELVVAHYRTTKDKQPLPGVGVKVGTVYEFERKAAFEWAKGKGLCITPEQLDIAAFTDLCKSASNRPEFVKVIEDPKANIAADLTKTLTAVAAPVTVEAPAEAGVVA
jgi:hypothetical protein